VFKPEENTLIIIRSIFNKNFPDLLRKNPKSTYELFFVNYVKKRLFCPTKIYGQFLSEFENHPEKILDLEPGSAISLYFPIDQRVYSYGRPTRSDIDHFYSQMDAINKLHPLLKVRRAAQRLSFKLRNPFAP